MMPESNRCRRVWAVYVVYCLLSSAMNLGLFLFSLSARMNREAVWSAWIGADMYAQVPPATFSLMEFATMAIGAFFCVGDVAVLFVPRDKRGWVVGVVNIAIGLGSCVFTPLCVWLLVMWLRIDIRREFQALPPGAE
ncbi:MAG: hypothetical protein JSS65_04090 [Armatimonadetes bacterium]|nr:hypothetical protein [Armatimonadota bacterium]